MTKPEEPEPSLSRDCDPRGARGDLGRPEPPVNVLLVDDMPGNLLALEAVLGDMGLNLVTAQSGEAALGRLLRDDFAVILLDVYMPGIDGLETAALIRQRVRSGETPIIFVTAAGRSEELIARGYAVGAVDYIVKPIQPAILRSKVAVFADLFRSRRQVARQAAQLAALNAELEERVRARTAELEQARAAAEAERDRLQQVLDALPAGVVIADVSGVFTMCNAVATAMFGPGLPGRPVPRSDAEAFDTYGTRRLEGTPYPSVELPLQRTLWRGEMVRGEQFVTRAAATGQDITILAHTAPLRGADGSIVGVVGVFQDITPLKQAERAREEFIASASHDLKNPLTGIRGQAQLAHRRLAKLPGETAPILAQLDNIDDATMRMLAMINELIDLTRVQMGAVLDLERRPTDLVALVRRVMDQHQSSHHRLCLEAAVPELWASVDATRLERVVANLLSNAIKYSPAGGDITVRVAREETAAGPEGRVPEECVPQALADAVIEVRDAGLGIPAADLPHIFERFRRGANVAGRISGTGIGLASAQDIVTQHGGVIAVESQEGSGSTFTARLPLI